jgi:hypothetical protein
MKDIQKVYFFYFLGVCAGYLGTFDKINLALITIPTMLLIAHSNFDFQKSLLDKEKQNTYNLILSIIKEGLDLRNQNNLEEFKKKLHTLFMTFFNGMGFPPHLQSFVFNNLFNRLRSE